MTENLLEKLHQRKRKQVKDAKMLQNFLQNIWKKNMQNQTNAKHFRNPEDIFKSAKNFLEKLNLTTISKFLSKIPNRKKTSKKQYNFCKAKISVEVHGM